MPARILSVVALVALMLALVGCSSSEPATTETPTPPESEAPTGGDPAAGLRLAPGYYKLEDGTAQALGRLEYRDIEGGFWAVIDDTQTENGEGKVAAVIANSADFEDELKPLEGKQVFVTGKPAEGSSVRMAGPEITIEKVEELSDTPGIAE